MPTASKLYLGKFRIRRKKSEADLKMQSTEGVFLVFDAPQSAIAAGQFAAWYLENECIGSGVIG